MIGNDIIDLAKAKSESNWKRKGFLEKQFTNQEQRCILTAQNAFEMVWRLWSMKEAAYKAFVQGCKSRFFAPQKFVCKVRTPEKGIVYFEDHIFFTSSLANDAYIFTTASEEKDAEIYSKILPPKKIQLFIKKYLERKTNAPFLEIKQRKSAWGIPDYYHKNTRLTKSCTISHHGDYGAFSVLCD